MMLEEMTGIVRKMRMFDWNMRYLQERGLVVKGHDLGAHDGRAGLERQHVAHRGGVLALLRHHAGDLDYRVLLRLGEVPLHSAA